MRQLWNHSSTAIVKGQTFQVWFINDFMLDAKYGMSSLVSGFFWDDFWPAPGGGFPDALRGVAEDTGLDQDHAGWAQITEAYHRNMDALRKKTLAAARQILPPCLRLSANRTFARCRRRWTECRLYP